MGLVRVSPIDPKSLFNIFKVTSLAIEIFKDPPIKLDNLALNMKSNISFLAYGF